MALNNIANGYIEWRNPLNGNSVGKYRVEMVFGDDPHSLLILAITHNDNEGDVYHQFMIGAANSTWEHLAISRSLDKAIESIMSWHPQMKKIAVRQGR